MIGLLDIKSNPKQHAELLSLLEGLKVLEDFNNTTPEIEIDCTDAIKVLFDETSNFQNLIMECRWTMLHPKLPTVRHNFREGNQVAHKLAKESLKLPKKDKSVLLACPTIFVHDELHKDKHGTSTSSKNISVNVCNILVTMGNTNTLNSLSYGCNSFCYGYI